MTEISMVKRERIICPICKGAGVVSERDGAYDSKIVKCRYCKGKRVVIEITSHYEDVEFLNEED